MASGVATKSAGAIGRVVCFVSLLGAWAAASIRPWAASTGDSKVVAAAWWPTWLWPANVEPVGNELNVVSPGVIVTPGYYKQPELTAQMFDDEGFYQIGDAGRFVDPKDPSQGLVFDGRVVEDFKLMSGTFVLVGTLRSTAVAAVSPVTRLSDSVTVGCFAPPVV